MAMLSPLALPQAPSQVSEDLRPAAPTRPRPEGRVFVQFLLDEAWLARSPKLAALADRGGLERDAARSLVAHGLMTERRMTEARAVYHDLPLIDPGPDPPDVRLIDRLGASNCARFGLLPWQRWGDTTIVLADRPEAALRHADRLQKAFGPVSLALCPRSTIDASLGAARGAALRRDAETRAPAGESCRSLPSPLRSRRLWRAAGIASAAALLLPGGFFSLLTLIGAAVMVAATCLKAAALIAALRRLPAPTAPPAIIAHLPVVSVLVPLLREAEIAPRLVRRLGRIDYPRELLDILLVVEEADTLTRRALARTRLPGWMRVIVVPDGALKTKPRALNYGLDFCRGSLIGVWDAEDAPAPGQIAAVVERFHQRGPQVACLQGILDFYNPETNGIARCFTLEYAAWFRVILPGLARLGLPIPLGGTTLFFRRAALEALGGWDAHNVTEDADLGFRLCRHGYRTEILDTVTREEANCHALPWIRQRSRWIKGYMMTWRVHMRDPVRLWRDLGPRGFLALQVLVLGSVVNALLTPVLLSFWLMFAGFGYPIGPALPWPVVYTLFGLFLLCEAVNLTVGFIGLSRSGHRLHPLWLLAMHLYHPLASLACYKALWEVIRCPFWWDKTRHGKFDRAADPTG